MSFIIDVFQNLRAFLRKAGIDPSSVTVTIGMKDAEDFAKFEKQKLTELAPYGIPSAMHQDRMVGIGFAAEIAKPKPDGKDRAVNILVDSDNLADITIAINKGLAALREDGTTVFNIGIERRMLVTDPGNVVGRLCYSTVVVVSGKRI